MMKATVKTPDGRGLLLLGLSFRNLDEFRDHPCDTFIKVRGEEIGLPVDVVIMSGETEAKLGEFMMEFIGPDTRVHIDEKLKS